MKFRDLMMVAASTAAVGIASTAAVAGGVIRDAGVATAGHAAVAIGNTFSSYSNTSSAADFIGLNNPTKLSALSAPNSQTGSSADWGFYPDVAASLTNVSGLPAGSSSGFVSNLQAYRFTIAGATGTSTMGNRRVFGDSSLGSGMTLDTAGTYSGNTAATFTWASVGTGVSGLATSYRIKIEQTVTVTDIGLPGQALQTTSLRFTRLTAGSASDALNLKLSLGLLADINAGPTFAQTGTTQTNTSGSGEIRIRSAVSSGSYAEVIGTGATSFDVGLRSTSSTGGLLPTNSRLFGNAELSNNLALTGVSGTSDIAVGLVWNNLNLAAVGNSTTVSTQVLLVPAPGAAALLGLGGLIATRRRRN